jgi:DNA-directed RNA polymerase subunit beta'
MSDKLTTAGALKLKAELPTQEARDNFNIYQPLDKKGMGDLIHMLLKHAGPHAAEHINGLGKQFFEKATEIGASTPLSDYQNNSDELNAIIGEYDSKVQRIIHDPNTSRTEKQMALGNLTSEYNKIVEKQNLGYLLERGSTAAKMAFSGARGNPAQLAVGTATPLMAASVKGELIPVVIKSSFAKGMTPAEQTAFSYMGRSSTVLSQLSTSKPGALFKELSPTLFHETITIEDCKTKNGVPISLKDHKALLGRFTADTNRLVDERMIKELSMSHAATLKVRSTLTCEAQNGICAHCYGLRGDGKMPEIGENVGVIAAQSVSEVLTQALLSTKHKSTVGERRGNAFEQASNVLRNPAENFQDEATISEINGKVTDLKKTPLGDTNVFINEKGHFVPIAQRVTVQVGDKVRKGEALSTGVVNPRKLVALRGIGAGRVHLASELRDIYKGGLDPRHFDLIARNLIKHVEVVDPGETGFLPGEKVEVNQVAKYLKKFGKETPIDEAEGGVLAKAVHELTPGTFLDSNHIQDLKDRGVTSVSVSNNGLKVSPIVPGLKSVKMLDNNWISRLSFSRLKDTLREGAALGLESPIHSSEPITPYIIGSEFGDGENGEY